MDAWRNERSIKALKIEVEKQMLEMRTKHAALYKYMELIDIRTKDCRPVESEAALKAMQAITKRKRKKK